MGDPQGIPIYSEADENTALLADPVESDPKWRSSLSRLQTGLKSWIKVNKSRKEQLGQSVEKCENIKEHSSDVESLMMEASRIQQHMKESITRTTNKLMDQTTNLNELKQATTKVGEQMKEVAEWSPWTPPRHVIYGTLICFLLAAVVCAVPYILNASGIYRIHFPKDPYVYRKSE